MIAVGYLAIVVLFGDAVARRWFTPATWLHRIATAFLVGLLISTWLSYLASLAFDATGDELAPGNILAVWVMVVATFLLRRHGGRDWVARPTRSPGWDWAFVALLLVFVSWLMVSTYSYADGQLRIASGLWSDFGPTTAIAQNFALGDNFPTEYPHYAGEAIRYHFLYYFQVGNLTFLGLDPATANNILSIGSMVAMLVLVMALGERLFGSPLVGRIGAVLFFLHGSLSFIPYLGQFTSIDQALAAIPQLDHFISSGFPYRGEDWGIWTQMVFLNQRHLASAIGILLVIVLFLLERQPMATAEHRARGLRVQARAAARGTIGAAVATARRPVSVLRGTLRDPALGGYVLCGVLAGSLPLWNGAMFIAAAAILAVWLLVFPGRPRMVVLGIAACIPAIPQLLWVRPGTMAGEQTYPSFYWGYVLDDPDPATVARYFAFIFGPKLLLVGLALVLCTWRERRVFLAFASLVAVAFLVQLSVEVLANHKFINAWLIVANLFAAYGLIRLWEARLPIAIPARAVAAVLAVIIGVGGVIDLMPVKNQGQLEFAMDGDPLFEWVRTETDPRSVFLTDIHVVHPILLAGRRLYFGWPYYAWSAGYATGEREAWYRDTFAERGAGELARRLRDAGIDYVAIDDGLRQQTFTPRLNEDVFRTNFETAFAAAAGTHDGLVIYRVPTDAATIDRLPGAPAQDMYTGDCGTEPGRFDGPRGVALERAGTILVADTDNDRLQRFSSNGNLVAVIGGPGDGPGQFAAPTGIATDPEGVIYVADVGNGRVQHLGPDGSFIREWRGPEAGFEGLVDVAMEHGALFALDAAAGTIIRLEADGTTTTVVASDGDGALLEPTGLAAEGGRLAVADMGNARIVVFRQDGTFERTIEVEAWRGVEDRTADVDLDRSGLVWVTSPATDEVLVFGEDGTERARLVPQEPDTLDRPTGLALRPGGSMFVVNGGGCRMTLLPHARP
jgi:sugar lactone lactonase YvrE